MLTGTGPPQLVEPGALGGPHPTDAWSASSPLRSVSRLARQDGGLTICRRETTQRTVLPVGPEHQRFGAHSNSLFRAESIHGTEPGHNRGHGLYWQRSARFTVPKGTLPLGPNAAVDAAAAAGSYVALKVGPSPGYDIAGYQITSDSPAAAEVARSIPNYLQRFKVSMLAFSWCGTEIGQRTYVVHVVFPAMIAAEDGAAVANMNLFVSRLASGWTVWDTY